MVKILMPIFLRTWSIIDSGVSNKPCPCRGLTHPFMYLLLEMVADRELQFLEKKN